MNEITLAGKLVAWFVALWLARNVLYMTVGGLLMCAYFPEGKRWWMPFARAGALILFAGVVLANPFISWSLK